jgi:hypothetical protein
LGLTSIFTSTKNHGIEFPNIWLFRSEIHTYRRVWIFLFLLWITPLLNEIENPICDLEWNNFVYESIIHGKETHVPSKFIARKYITLLR